MTTEAISTVSAGTEWQGSPYERAHEWPVDRCLDELTARDDAPRTQPTNGFFAKLEIKINPTIRLLDASGPQWTLQKLRVFWRLGVHGMRRLAPFVLCVQFLALAPRTALGHETPSNCVVVGRSEVSRYPDLHDILDQNDIHSVDVCTVNVQSVDLYPGDTGKVFIESTEPTTHGDGICEYTRRPIHRRKLNDGKIEWVIGSFWTVSPDKEPKYLAPWLGAACPPPSTDSYVFAAGVTGRDLALVYRALNKFSCFGGGAEKISCSSSAAIAMGRLAPRIWAAGRRNVIESMHPHDLSDVGGRTYDFLITDGKDDYGGIVKVLKNGEVDILEFSDDPGVE